MPTTRKLISAVTLGSDSASVTISSIPASYTDIVLSCSVRSTASVTADLVAFQFNGAGNTNLSSRAVYGWGTTIASTSTSNVASYGVPGASAAATVFGSAELYISDYSSSSVNKAVALVAVSPNNVSATGANGVSAGLWNNTSPITQITCLCSGGSLLAGSTFYLYGVSKA